MKKMKTEEHDTTVVDLNTVKIKKQIMDETDPDCRDAVEMFLEKYKNDTLTGL